MSRLRRRVIPAVVLGACFAAQAVVAQDTGHGHMMNGSTDAGGMHGMKHGGMHDMQPGQGMGAGMPGDPAQVSRTVPVNMSDDMHFDPARIEVKAGETVRFFVINKGQMPHEMMIGTAEQLDEHAEMMRSMPDMQHHGPNQIRLAPGQRGGIVWKFDQPGTYAFACLIPGHKEAGMVGKVVVQ